MTRTVLANTGAKVPTYIGRCLICRKTYRWDVPAEYQTSNPYWYPADPAKPWCNCRAGIRCEDWRHVMPDTLPSGGHDHPQSAINFKPLNGTYVETKRCGVACENASSNKCACSCGGENHGLGHALDAAGVR